LPTSGLTHHDHVWLVANDHSQALMQQGMIVNAEDSNLR
jgi:hypothetical protein